MTCQRPSDSRLQIELKLPTRFPWVSNTGPLLIASVPDGSDDALVAETVQRACVAMGPAW